jgi:hypothetical protein
MEKKKRRIKMQQSHGGTLDWLFWKQGQVTTEGLSTRNSDIAPVLSRVCPRHPCAELVSQPFSVINSVQLFAFLTMPFST